MQNGSSLKTSLLPWFMWGLGGLFYFYEFFVQVSPNVMAPELMRDFVISAYGLSILHSILFWSYASLQIPAGLFIDILGPRRLLTFAAINCGMGCLLFGLAEQFSVALLARFLIGVGSSVAAIACFKLAANWFPMRRFALMTGLTVMIGMSGAVVGQKPLALIVEIFNWRITMIALGVIGIFGALIFFFFMRDQPQSDVQVEYTPYPTFKDARDGLLRVIKSSQIWFTAIYGSLMFTPTLTLGGLWGASYMTIKYGITRPEAAASISLIFVGWLIGAPLGGYISDRIGRRLPPMILGSLGALVSLTAFLYWPGLSLTNADILLLLFGLFSAFFLPAFSIVRESSPKKSTATALGFMNMMNMLGLVFVLPLIGYLLDYFYDNEIIKGVHHYTLVDYDKALFVLPLILLCTVLILPFIKETYCHFLEDDAHD